MLYQIHPIGIKDFVSFWQNQFLIEYIERPEYEKNNPSGAKTNAIVKYIAQSFCLKKYFLKLKKYFLRLTILNFQW